MSYLDVPRLHFSGTFTADPPTINNSFANYGYNPASQTPISISPSWNPYGSHAFTINAQVTSFVDNEGTVHTSDDPLIGATFASTAKGNPAKLVDLDTQQQGVTRLFGLNLQLTLSGKNQQPVLQGLWDNGGTLTNLWFGRVPGVGGDSGAGGQFQSVLRNIQWGDLGGSALLQQLNDAAGEGLSVALTVYGYDAATTDPNFRTGKIVGTIGPQLAGEPLHLPPRLLLPAQNSPLSFAAAKVNAAGTAVTVDLGNSIPDVLPGGPKLALGPMTLVVSDPNPTALGTVNYLDPSFQQTAGVVQFPITAEQAGNPLGVSIGPPSNILLQESPNGVYIDIDGYSLYMNPGQEASVNVWAFTFGSPTPGVQVPLTYQNPNSAAGSGPSNNTPLSALRFPASVTTGNDGWAPIPLQSGDPGPAARPNITGQLYFLGGGWSTSYAATVGSAPLSVKLFSSVLAAGDQPKWADVQPILYRFYYMYGYMASIVDLSNYDDVKANAQPIKQVLSLDFNDAGYMPVSREMANAERDLILQWINAGCPAG